MLQEDQIPQTSAPSPRLWPSPKFLGLSQVKTLPLFTAHQAFFPTQQPLLVQLLQFPQFVFVKGRHRSSWLNYPAGEKVGKYTLASPRGACSRVIRLFAVDRGKDVGSTSMYTGTVFDDLVCSLCWTYNVKFLCGPWIMELFQLVNCVLIKST